VDAGRIGVVGYSWGGVITLLVNGIDDRVAAACDVFGAGYIPDDSIWVTGQLSKVSARDKRVWRDYYDPSNYLKSQHGRTLFVGATADHYYPLRSFIKTYGAAECDKALCLALNKDHELDETASASIGRWFDWALKSGPALPKIRVKQDRDVLKVSGKGRNPLVEVSLALAEGSDFTKADFKLTSEKGKDGTWRITPPKTDAAYFLVARDDRGAVIVDEVHLPPAEAKLGDSGH